MINLGTRQLDAVLDRQKRAWLDGSHSSIEDILSDSSLPSVPEVLLDLIYNEILLREELGHTPTLAEYVQRYPHLHEELRLHFEVHHALQEKLLNATRPVQDTELVQEIGYRNRDLELQLPNYEILGELGSGGMGIVYKARHHRLKRTVALKMFKPGRQPQERELKRFRTEAEAVARLQHPNIVQIFEVGEQNGSPYLALEFVEQGTLAERLQLLPFSPRAAGELVETLARAIHHAHERQIIHRDLKPANVLLTPDGTPKITDFGLAKILEEDLLRDLTLTGEPVGTPRYMSPEQAAGMPGQIGPATDVYSLGTMLYECLTGHVPFVSSSVIQTMKKIVNDDPPPPRQSQTTIPRDLEIICLNCLHKQPGRRYVSALALANDLRRFLQGEPIHARPTPAWERAWMWCQRRPTQAAMIALGVLAMTASLVVFGILQYRENQRVERLERTVQTLIHEGRQALDNQDDRTADGKFWEALKLVGNEPALSEYFLTVSGWLDHTRRKIQQSGWNKRPGPPLYEELRDEAYLLSIILDPQQPETVQAARLAVQSALEKTLPHDPAWQLERAQLLLLDAELVSRQGNAEQALALLNASKGVASSLWHHRRADYLEQLGKKEEADQERNQAENLPPQDSSRFFLQGVDHFLRQDFAGALADFDQALSLEPDHFTARFFQAVCFLRLNRPGEARVALTAGIGQRPRFLWSFIFRGQAYTQLGEFSLAAQDFHRATELNPKPTSKPIIRLAIDIWEKKMLSLPEKRREALLNESIRTESGLQRVKDLPIFKK